jgi:putative ABC transport system permease protein
MAHLHLSRVERAALRWIPAAWRGAIAHDLAEERPAGRGAAWLVVQALIIGTRLRLAQLAHAFGAHSPGPGSGIPDSRQRTLLMHDLARDFALAARGALRRPAYSLAVIATLAIGIGANTAIYSVFNWILLRPLPGVERPQELVTIKFQMPSRQGTFFVAYRDYADLRDGMTTSVEALAVAAPRKLDLSTGGDARMVDGELVTTNYLAMLGVRPLIGRDFTPDEEQPGGPASAIISAGLWHEAFGRDPGALGRTLRLNGRPFTIVGVAPDGFQGRSPVIAAQVWYTISGHLTLQPKSDKPADLLTSRRSTMLGDAFGRLRPGVTLEQAQAEAVAAASHPEFATAFTAPGKRSEIQPVLYAGVGLETYTQKSLALVFRLLMGAVGLLLLLACANAANLLLARASARRREIAVCQAIGASRFRIIRQHLAEGLVLSVVAGGVGLALAVWLVSIFDGMRITTNLPAVTGVGVDWRVGAFALGLSLVTGLLFAAAPSVVSSRVDLQSSLKDGQHGSCGGRRLLRGSLVAMQVTVSVVLLVAAGLFIRTLQNIRGLDLGIESERIVSFSIQPGRFGLDTPRSTAYLAELLERVQNAPGVERAAFSWTTSFSSNMANAVFTRPDDGDTPVTAAQTTVSPGFFATMGIPLLAGRDFTQADASSESAANVVIISRALADALYPDGSALGSRLELRFPKGASVEVIGIAGDVRGRSVTKAPEPWSYRPAVKPSWGTIQVRTALPEAQMAAAIREVARSIDPVVTPHDIEAFGASVDRALSEERLFARLSAIFAVVAVLIAGIGIFGMMAGAVAERRKEFGIRLALGARGRAIAALVLRSALVLSAIGLAIGLAGATVLRRFIESRLFGVTAMDPLTIASAVAAILSVGIVASLVPAMRAARVDPVRSLRVE